jgi:hypothetical protein
MLMQPTARRVESGGTERPDGRLDPQASRPALDDATRDTLGRTLRSHFADTLGADLPGAILVLASRLLRREEAEA